MTKFTHLDQKGNVRMVDVSDKGPTHRQATAQAVLHMNCDTFDKIFHGDIKKGNVLETARIAGIMAAKKTHDLIPMCHPLNITHAKIDFFPNDQNHTIVIKALVKILSSTGVEMEAMTAASIAALTIYDMCKSHDRSMVISQVSLLEKRGGKSGVYQKQTLSEGISTIDTSTNNR